MLHVLHYEEKFGPVPPGRQLDHLCRQTLCVNPDHLEPVTPAENVRRGDASPLTHADVEEIKRLGIELLRGRTRRPPGSREAIARRFGVCDKTITNIWRGATWA